MLYSVPSMVSDLVDSSGKGYPLDTLTYGGAPAPDNLPLRVKRSFPTANASVLAALGFFYSDFGLQEPRLRYDGNEWYSNWHKCVLSSPYFGYLTLRIILCEKLAKIMMIIQQVG